MAHGKETPRQKMIGMMYLVLLALLALTVSKEVIDAFVIVEESVFQTTKNFSEKNELMYQEFDQAAAEQPVKATKWKKIADQVRDRSNELYEYIQDLKLEIVKEAEGENSEAIHEREIRGKEIGKKEDQHIPAQIMIGNRDQGKANDLRMAIEGYREFLISLLHEKEKYLKEAIEKSLETNDRIDFEGVVHTWQTDHFEYLPLMAVITLMSKMQGDVRNAESEIITYLYNQIDAGAFKFNKLEATVIPSSNYILQGTDYVAKIFFAARDTTQPPEVFIGEYDSLQNPDGTWTYEMVGNYDSIFIEEGKGIFRRTGQKEGIVNWGGLIRIKNPDGAYTSKPFHQSYRVAPPHSSISPTKMNVFYKAVDNPVSVSASGIPDDEIQARIIRGNGTMIKKKNLYIVKPTTNKDIVISVFSGDKPLGQHTFRVKNVPEPTATVMGASKGRIDKEKLQLATFVRAEMPEWFEFDLEYTVTGFLVETIEAGGYSTIRSSTNYMITEEQKTLLARIRKNSIVWFNNIKAVGPDGAVITLNDITLKIN